MSRPLFNVNVWDFGERPGAWRDDRLGVHANTDPDFWIGVAKLVECSGLDGVFLADSPSLNEDPQVRPHRFMEPLVIHATLAAHTETIGLVATTSSSFNDPMDLADRAFLLDRVTQGRFAVNIVTTVSPVAARLFGQEGQAERGVRYARAQEFADAYVGYWRARKTGRPFRFEGNHFTYRIDARPPLDIPDLPVIFQAGGSAEGIELAGRSANAVFSAEMHKDGAIRNRAAVRLAAERHGRAAPAVLPGLSVIIGSTEEEARRRFDHYEQLGPPNFLLRHLNRLLGANIGLDELDVKATHIFDRLDVANDSAAGSLGFRRSVRGFAAGQGLTVRQLLYHFGGYGHQIVIGTPDTVANLIEDWWRSGAVDGFNLIPDVFPSGLERFVDHVLPKLAHKGLFYEPGDSRRTPWLFGSSRWGAG